MQRSEFHRIQAKRRGFLIGGAGLGAGGLFIAACGGSSNNNSSRNAAATSAAAGSPGAAAPSATAVRGSPAAAGSAAPAQSTANIKKGGTLHTTISSDPPSLDPDGTASANSKGILLYVYSKLYAIDSVAPNADGVVPFNPVPDAAESATPSADGLTYTVKLKGNVKFHPPVNRNMTAEDVVFSWQRYNGKLPGGKPAPTVDRAAFIDDVKAVDDLTVQFHLKSSHASFLSVLADTNILPIMPKETGTAFDPAKVMVGSGPFIFDRYQPGSLLAFKRNPQWHFGPDRPYVDGIEINVVKEAATALNQFLGGNLDVITISGLDIGDAKKKIPGVQLRVADTGGLVGVIGFSRVSEQRQGAPWTDIRVRRAMSMAIDREGILDGAYNFSKIAQQGLNLPRRWGGVLAPSYGDLVVDPKTDPQSSQYFKFDPKAAKALLDQAGFGSGFSIDGHFTPAYGPLQNGEAELIAKYWGDIGIKVNLVSDDYVAKWIPQIQQGNYEGTAFFGQAGIIDPGDNLRALFSKDSSINFGKVNDPKVEDYLSQYDTAVDPAKRRSILTDLQRYLLPQMYYVPSEWAAGAVTVFAYQPNIRGPEAHQSFGYGAGDIDQTFWWKA